VKSSNRLEASGFTNGTSSIGKNFSVGLFNLLNNPYRKIELPIIGRFKTLAQWSLIPKISKSAIF